MKHLPANTEFLKTDLAIIGSGGAGLMAVLQAARTSPELDITLVSKGLVGRSGCTIMTQGFNAVMNPADSFESHFQDMLKSGEYLNDQDLAWQLVNGAPDIIRDLEHHAGCYFDRGTDGLIEQLPFAGQSFDRKVHRGIETGLEIMGRMSEQLVTTRTHVLEDVRALDLIVDDNGGVAGLALLDTKRGIPLVLRATVVIVATGGAANMYRFASAAKEKTGDGMAMCYRAGAEFRDMEMMQFLSVGLVSGSSQHSGIPLEERLRYAGVYLENSMGERFMERYQPDVMERATRDQVIRACYQEIESGKGTAAGGILVDARHLGREILESSFSDIVARARLLGQDPVVQKVEMSPTAHFQIGGALIRSHGETNISGLLVAGEDAGGVHGASWIGGNGVAESTVFGARAGVYGAKLCRERNVSEPSMTQASEVFERDFAALARTSGDQPLRLNQALRDMMWLRAGPVRSAVGLQKGLAELDEIEARQDHLAIDGSLVANPLWQQALDLRNLLTVARLVLVSALAREESRGVHFRTDFPDRNDTHWLRYVVLRKTPGGPVVDTRQVQTHRHLPGTDHP